MTRLLHTLLHLTTIFYIQFSRLNSLLYFDYDERICLRSPSTLVAENRACPWINQRTVEPCKFDISCPVLFVVNCMFYVERQMWSWFVSFYLRNRVFGEAFWCLVLRSYISLTSQCISAVHATGGQIVTVHTFEFKKKRFFFSLSKLSAVLTHYHHHHKSCYFCGWMSRSRVH